MTKLYNNPILGELDKQLAYKDLCHGPMASCILLLYRISLYSCCQTQGGG